MKKSHIWDTIEILEVKCLYCRKEIEKYYGCFDIGDILECSSCKKEFELGEQK